jgi:hypothetical protein
MGDLDLAPLRPRSPVPEFDPENGRDNREASWGGWLAELRGLTHNRLKELDQTDMEMCSEQGEEGLI